MNAVQLWDVHPRQRLTYLPTAHTVKAVRVFLLCELERVNKSLNDWRAALDTGCGGCPDTARWVRSQVDVFESHRQTLEYLIPNAHLRSYPDSSVIRAEEVSATLPAHSRAGKARKVK